MVDEVITIPELQETLTATGTDLAVVRQSGLDKKVSLATMKNYFITEATVSIAGIVQLNNTVTSTSITQAGTANAVRVAYNTGVTAQQTAQSAINQLSGKANTVHTHTAADTVSGVFSTARLPLSNLNSFGICRHTSSLANPSGDSANGYVPSLPLVANINNAVNSINNTLNTLASNGTYNRWDGGATGLNAAQGLLSLGAAPLTSPKFIGNVIVNNTNFQIGEAPDSYIRINRFGQLSLNGGVFNSIVSSPTPPSVVGRSFLTTHSSGIVSYPRVNADNTVTYRDATGLKSDLGISSANESTIGLVSEANQAEVNAGSAVNKYVSPSKLKSGSGRFGNSTTGGYNYPDFMDGMEERWGVLTIAANTTANIPNLHTNQTLNVIVSLSYINFEDDSPPPRAIPNGNGILIANADEAAKTIRYFTKGY